MEKDIQKLGKDDTDIQALYEELEKKVFSYHRVEEDIDVIRLAFKVAKEAHRFQRRASGEPYIIHPLHVAMILADLKLDKDTIVAALLHDVVEDTEVRRSDIEAWFGEDIAFLVDGVTKIADLPKDLTKKQIKQESFLKLIFATADDIRVIVIKLADRLHNMRTMDFQSFEKQERISKETLEIYAPIAQRLGISIISTELEDLAFSYLKPEAYRNIFEQVQKNNYKGKLLPDMDSVHKILEEGGIEHELAYHQKHFFSIHRKMLNRHKSLEELYGIGVIKVIVESEKDCYLALWKLHSNYKILPGRIKDYISLPREDMYQALHTTLISKNGGQFKVRIKTREMERFSKFGVLGHWEYAISGGEVRNVSHAQGKASFWLQRILQWQEDAKNTAELMDLVKDDFDLFLEKICCFTPDAEAKHLPKGATVIDFAYAIHSEVGNKAIGAIIGGKRKDLDAVLKDGEVVQILRKEESPGPQAYWLDFAKTANARSNIRKALKLQQGKDNETIDFVREESTEGMHIQMAKCCLPVRGDAVTGVMSNEHYLTLHRDKCSTAEKLLKRRTFKEREVRWDEVKNENFLTTVEVVGDEDGLWMPTIWNYLHTNNQSINRMEFWDKKQSLTLSVRVKDKRELKALMRSLEEIEGIKSVSRVQ